MARRPAQADTTHFREHVVAHTAARWPYGMCRAVAAEYTGFSASHFDKMVAAGKMPAPRREGSRLVWLQDELQAACRALPTEVDEDDDSNEWDRVA